MNVPLQEKYVVMNPNPSFAFGELPSFADSILYPEKRQHQVPDPTTRATFQGRPGRRADLCEKLQGNIRLEGEYLSEGGMSWRVSNGAAVEGEYPRWGGRPEG